MKRSLVITMLAVLALVIICIAACAANSALQFTEPDCETGELDGVKLTLDAETYPLGTKVLTGVISNETDSELTFGVDFSLQALVDNQWKRVEYKSDDVAWISIAMIVAAHESENLDFDVEACYPPLPVGHYRIVKNVSLSNGEAVQSQYIAAQFTVTSK